MATSMAPYRPRITDTSSLASSPRSSLSLHCSEAVQPIESYYGHGPPGAISQKRSSAFRLMPRRTSSVYSHKSTPVIEFTDFQSQQHESTGEIFFEPTLFTHSAPNLPDQAEPEYVTKRQSSQLLASNANGTNSIADYISTLRARQESASAESSNSDTSPEHQRWSESIRRNFEPSNALQHTPLHPPAPSEYFTDEICAQMDEIFADSPPRSRSRSPEVVQMLNEIFDQPSPASGLPLTELADTLLPSLVPPNRPNTPTVRTAAKSQAKAMVSLGLDANTTRIDNCEKHRAFGFFRMLPKQGRSVSRSKTDEDEAARPPLRGNPAPSEDIDTGHTEEQMYAKDYHHTLKERNKPRRKGNASETETRAVMRMVPPPLFFERLNTHRRTLSTSSIKVETRRDSEALKGKASISNLSRHIPQSNSLDSSQSTKSYRSNSKTQSRRCSTSSGPNRYQNERSETAGSARTSIETSGSSVTSPTLKFFSLHRTSRGNPGALQSPPGSAVSTSFKNKSFHNSTPNSPSSPRAATFGSLKSSVGSLKRSATMSKADKKKDDLKKSIRVIEGSFR